MDSHAVFLRSAGTTHSATTQLIAAVRRAVQTQNADELQRDLCGIGFEDRDAFIVATTVSITRNLDFPAKGDLPVETDAAKLLDGMGVMCMFNIVNRIANAEGLEPEWAEFRRTDSLCEKTRTLMAFGLPHQMPLAEDPPEQCRLSGLPFEPLLDEFGIESVSPAWRALRELPPVEFAIYQLLEVAVHDARADRALLGAATQACLASASAGACDGAQDYGCHLWRQLFVEPYKVSPEALSTLPLSEEVRLDLIFRVSLLAAVHKFNDARVRELLASCRTRARRC